MVASSNQVLMQTATAVVENSQGTSSVSVRLILDSGSQRSYITDKLAKGLKLTVDPIHRRSQGGQGRAFAQPSLIFALPSKFCQSK